jgi:hypothetical protein
VAPRGSPGYNWIVPEPLPRPVAGSTVLPAGFGHPHASEEAREIAEEGMILRVQVGSGVHGTAVSGQDDRDEMGLCLEPPQFVTGLARVPNGIGGQGPSVRFAQYERHTAWDRPGGVANRSGPGDLDVIIYSARKWARLALAGNPTVLLVLFAPDEEVVFRNDAGAELTGNAHQFVSRLAAIRFLGYLRAQKAAMTGQVGAHTNRPELVAVHGYDTKYATHALRLGLQGIEFLTTGRITLPVPEPHRGYLRSIRQGEVPLADVLEAITRAETLLAPEAVHLERQKDVGEAPEQREEPDPDQQQQRPRGKLLLGDPEAEQDLYHARDHAQPPGGVDLPRGDRGDQVEAAAEDEQQPEDRGQRPERAERARE